MCPSCSGLVPDSVSCQQEPESPPMRAGTGSHDAVKTGGQQVRPVHPSGAFRPPSGSFRIHTSGSDQSQTWSVKRYTARLSRFYKPAKITERASAVVGRFRSILYGGCRDDVEETVKGWRGSERKLDANARQPPPAHHAQTSLWGLFLLHFFGIGVYFGSRNVVFDVRCATTLGEKSSMMRVSATASYSTLD